MKIALPIALLAFGTVMVVLLLTPRHWKERTYADWQSDNDKIEEAKQKWFKANPAMEAEDTDLHQKYQQADAANRKTKDTWYEERQSLNDHDQKIRDELVKTDPSLKTIYARLEFDKEVPLEWGDQELLVRYGLEHRSPFDDFVTVFILFYPLLMIGVGILLLIRPPSFAGAHLFLIFVMLPLVWCT